MKYQSIKFEEKKQGKRIYVATENLYAYRGEESWSVDNPSVYGKVLGMTAKEVKEELLYATIRKGAKFSLEDNDGIDKKEYPYCLRSIRGNNVVRYESLKVLEMETSFRMVK